MTQPLVFNPPGVPLFDRSSTITVGTVQIQNIGQQTGLDVEFTVKRNLKASEPNTADLKIWNLSESTRKSLEQSSQPTKAISAAPGSTARVVPVRIDAGFVNDTSMLFLGEMRSAESVTDGSDIVTELTTGDGDQALALQRINMAFGPGATTLSIVQALLQQMGIGNGNLSAASSLFQSAPYYQKGVVLKGNAADRMAMVCASVGLEFTIQGGQAQFLKLGTPLAGDAFVLAPNTGLTGTPTVDTKGILQCECLMLPGLAPGSPIEIDSAFVQGLFRICSIETRGSTFGNDWNHRIEAKRYGASP